MAIKLRDLGFGPLGPLTLTLDPGALTVIVGPNGAGKSLLLRLLHGLDQPAAGTLGGVADARAMVFHEPMMLDRSVRRNLEWAARAPVAPIIAATGLTELAERRATTLSRGEQQRVALARAWASAPRLILADELTANLDPAETRRVEGLIEAMRADGIGVIMTTHDLGQARRLADHIVVLVAGQCIESTPAAQFWHAPQSPVSTRFIDGELLA